MGIFQRLRDRWDLLVLTKRGRHVVAEKVLGYLATVDEAYGLIIQDNTAVRTGNLYPTLRWAERKKWVTSRVGDPLPERGGRPRRYYTITDKGRDFLSPEQTERHT